MEEKIDKKTRIKEWIFVIGVIVVVTVASIIAYNYGLKKNETKKENKVEEKITDVNDENSTNLDAVAICKKNLDSIYNQVMDFRNNSWVSKYYNDYLLELEQYESKNQIHCDTAETYKGDYDGLSENGIIIESVNSNVNEFIFFNTDTNVASEYKYDIEYAGVESIEYFAAVNKSSKILESEISNLGDGLWAIVPASETVDVENYEVSLINEAEGSYEDDQIHYIINLTDGSYKKVN